MGGGPTQEGCTVSPCDPEGLPLWYVLRAGEPAWGQVVKKAASANVGASGQNEKHLYLASGWQLPFPFAISTSDHCHFSASNHTHSGPQKRAKAT